MLSEIHLAGKAEYVKSVDAVLGISLTALLLLIFVLPQSFAEMKLPLLVAVLAAVFVGARVGRWRIESSVVVYYLCFCMLALAWSMIGLFRGNPVQAIVEAVRVYVVFMLIYFGLTLCISNIRYQHYADRLIV